ncbi:hypothetical protein ANCDUO_24879 [Ancylostoma duodenale]|uniref:Uncharacterized protein n=1 Tax=Ancylostoma duodenale TaxID=51022 RepID=A0A0C2FJN2_9BILA|nr:hypothetical protein ANCDUO_24879 [Ancylostoma duodenale]
MRWAGHVMRFNDNSWTRAVSDWTPWNDERTGGRPPTRWSDFFIKSFKERYNALRVSRTDRIHWTTLGEGQMEGLLAPARYIRRSTGAKGKSIMIAQSHR